MPIYTIDNLTTKYTTLGESCNKMNAQAPAIRVQDAQEETHHESIVIIRPSFKKICDGEPCRAALFNHILYWIAKKRKQGVDYWYSTGDALYHDLAESWGVTQVRREIKKLIDSNLIGVMKNPRMAIDRTKHFFFQAAQATVFFAKCVTEKICIFCLGLCKEVIDLLQGHLINLLNAHPNDEAFDKSVKCVCAQHQEHLIELSKPFDKSIKAITQVSYSDNSVIPTESTQDSNLSSSLEDDALPPYEDGLKAQSVLAEWMASMTLMDDAFLAEQAAKLSTPVIPIVDTPSHIAMPTRKEQGDEAQQDVVAYLLAGEAHPRFEEKPVPAPPARRGKAKPKPTPEEIAFQDRCRSVQAQVNEWRGYGLSKRGAIINEHKAVQELCRRFTDKRISEIREYLFKHHWRWSKPDNRYTIGAQIILDEADNVEQILKNGKAPAKKPAREEELVLWQGRYMTEDEANTLGFNGGFGAYVSQQQF